MSEITTSQTGQATDASESVAQTDTRIRALTAMMHKLCNLESAQGTHPSKSSGPNSALAAATHVATLLTRVDGCGGENGSFLRPIAVAMHMHMTVDVVAVTDPAVTQTRSSTSTSTIRPVKFNNGVDSMFRRSGLGGTQDARISQVKTL